MKNPILKIKKFYVSLLAISSLLSAIQGYCSEFSPQITSCFFSHSLIEFKAGYFFFSNSKLKKIYKGGLDIQLCASYPLINVNSRWVLNAYGALEYFYQSGQSINEHQKTSIWSLPINIGLKPVYKINDIMEYYFAIGPRYSYIHQHNHSSFVNKNISKNSLGFFVNTGLNYYLCNHVVIDIFTEYSYSEIHFHKSQSQIYRRNIQISGFTFGGALGYEF